MDRVTRARRGVAHGLLALGALLALTVAVASADAPLTLRGPGRALTLSTPEALYALALVPLLSWLARGSLSSLSRKRLVMVIALRSAGFAALTLALAGPIEETRAHRTSTVLAVDVSRSLAPEAQAHAQRYVSRLLATRGDGHVALVTFAREPEAQPLPGSSSLGGLPHLGARDASDIERALSYARALLAPEAIPQLVLLSDGRETRGSLLRAAYDLAAQGVRLHVVPAPEPAQPEVGVRALVAPAEARLGGPFSLRATLSASAPARVHLLLLREGAPNQPDAARTLSLAAGETTVTFESRATHAGALRYRLTLRPEPGDRLPENDQAEATVRVVGPPRVLYVEREPQAGQALSSLLRHAGFEVELRAAAAAPRSLDELRDTDFYLLSDVPAAQLPHAKQEVIAAYVRAGGTFMMSGGERSFGPGGYARTRLAAILPVSMQGALEREEPSLALVLLIDKSGSMAGDKLERAKEAAIATAQLLTPDQQLGVIGFDASPMRILRLGPAHAKAASARAIGLLSAGGGTALFPALDACYDELRGVRARAKHVIVLTDGQTDDEPLAPLVRSMHADGITISTIGLGDDVQRVLLRELAESAGGRAYFTRDPASVPRLFAQEATLAARSQNVERSVRARRGLAGDFLKGVPIERAPPLAGFVRTRPRPPPAEVAIETEGGEPLLARMRVGRGWALALTTDLKPRWSASWFTWPPFSRLIAQLVRAHVAPAPERGERILPIQAEVTDDMLRASIEVLDAQERFVNRLTGVLEARHEGTLSAPLRSPLHAVSPGRYEAALPIERLGRIALEATLEGPDGARMRALGAVSHAFPDEYRPPFGVDHALLAHAAHLTGGEVSPEPEQLARPHERSSATQRVERWQLLVWLALGLFVLDVALRRLAPYPHPGPTGT